MRKSTIDTPERSGPLDIMLHLSIMAQHQDDIPLVLKGIHQYHHHPFHRKNVAPEREVVWQSGNVRIFRASAIGNQGKAPIFFIPSFINGSEILDLTPNRSIINFLAQQGHDCYLLDWGDLSIDEQAAGLDAIFKAHLIPALQYIVENNKELPHIAGYCLGGNIALALASICKAQYQKLILIAAPWDFHHEDNLLRPLLLNERQYIESLAAQQKSIAPNFLQSLFIKAAPQQAIEKYKKFAALDPESEKAWHFVAVEDWLNGAYAIPASLIEECMQSFYLQNDTLAERWKIGDYPAIKPSEVNAPCLIITPKSDNIVPYNSAAPLADQLPNATHIAPNTGHIAMIVGADAKETCWNNILDFLHS